MTRPVAIPSSLHAEVMRLRSEMNPDTGAPWTTREASRWLFETHGVKASRMAVTRLEAALIERYLIKRAPVTVGDVASRDFAK